MLLGARPPLVIGTHNRKKGAELADLLAPWGFHVLTLDDFPNPLEVVESGETFAANACLKAVEQARHLAHWVLADDSGLAVDALGGAPGVYSARYASLACAGAKAATMVQPPEYSSSWSVDDANNFRLLADLANVALERRTAHYVCHVALADPSGTVRAESHGVCHGRIRFEPVGANGFGYDPLFEIVEFHRTFGELGPHVKQVLSHRSRALRAMVPKLLAIHG